MSAGWQIGDLALCVDNDVRKREPMANQLVLGHIYRVRKCGIPQGTDCFCLAFEDILTAPRVGAAFVADRFRKIKPDQHEGCEPEFVTLLNRIKHSVSA